MRTFWKETAVKAMYTMAEAALGIIGHAVYVQDVNWGLLISAVALAGIVTVLKCLAVDLREFKSATELTEEEAEVYKHGVE